MTVALALTATDRREGAIRYGVYTVGKDNLTTLRDALTIFPIRLRIRSAFGPFVGIVALHRPSATFNLDILLPAIRGTRLVLNVLFGFIAGRHLPDRVRPMAVVTLAALAFNLRYGTAMSMREDQVSALFIDASAGTLWQLREMARAGQGSEPFAGALMRLGPSVTGPFITDRGRVVRAN